MQKHKETFGIHPIRAVLIETVDEARGTKLMDLINHPLVTGPYKRAGLFWFTISPLLTYPVQPASTAKPVAGYLDRPEIVFDPIWALPDRSMHSLTDPENSPTRLSASRFPTFMLAGCKSNGEWTALPICDDLQLINPSWTILGPSCLMTHTFPPKVTSRSESGL